MAMQLFWAVRLWHCDIVFDTFYTYAKDHTEKQNVIDVNKCHKQSKL